MKRRLLLADDDRGLESLFRAMLRDGDYDIEATFDGKSTLARMSQNDYSVILLDLMMPEVDGLEIVRQVASSSPSLARRIIVMTAAEPKIVASFDHGLVGAVVTKPFDVDAMRDLVDRIAGTSGSSAKGH